MKLILILSLSVLSIVNLFGQDLKKSDLIKLNDIDIYYEVYGDGEPLLLLHGWTQSSKFWKEYISTYSKNFKVYVLDLRGHGNSTPLDDTFSIKTAAKDVLEFLNHENITKVRAIGLSFGALVLLELANINPDRLESVILISATPNYNGASNKNANFLYENLPSTFIDQLKKNHPQGEGQIKALFNPDLNYQIHLPNETLQRFNFKTLIIHGDSDEILGIEPAFDLHTQLPNSNLWILPNTGHIPILGKNMGLFLQTSFEFLSSED